MLWAAVPLGVRGRRPRQACLRSTEKPDRGVLARDLGRAPHSDRVSFDPMRKFFLASLCSCFSFATLLRAQSTNASLTGRVTDPSQALIVGRESRRHQRGHEFPLTKLRPTARANTT